LAVGGTRAAYTLARLNRDRTTCHPSRRIRSVALRPFYAVADL